MWNCPILLLYVQTVVNFGILHVINNVLTWLDRKRWNKKQTNALTAMWIKFSNDKVKLLFDIHLI